MSKPLVIDNEVRKEIERVRKHAEKNVYTLDDLLDMKNGQLGPPGNDPNFTCHIPMGFKVVFSIEHQPGGKMRHMSMSSGPGRLPSQQAVEMVMHEFGFKAPTILDLYNVSIEEEIPGKTYAAVNVLELVD